MKISRSAVAPIVSVLALVLGNVFHVSLSNDLQGQITDVVVNAILLFITIDGIFKNHIKQ